MLADDGRVVFLDFGLMSTVPDEIMDAFALGIQSVLKRDWESLTRAFIRTGFVQTPIQWRPADGAPFLEGVDADGVDLRPRLTAELAERMQADSGGLSTFGALSTVLFAMGKRWQMRTPPYIILLIRTFLTLEGVVAPVDAAFNVYSASLPWAIRRALSPTTEESAAALRAALLTPANELRWAELLELAATAEPAAALPDASPATVATAAPAATALADDARVAASVSAITPLDSACAVLSSVEGSTLRRIVHDIDSTKLLLSLASPSARKVRRLAVDALASALAKSPGARARAAAAAAAPSWPESPDEAVARRRRGARFRSVKGLLLRSHARRQVTAGWRGAAATCVLACLVVRIGVAAVVKGLAQRARARGLRSGARAPAIATSAIS